MAQVSVSQTIQAQNHAEQAAPNKNQGSLKTAQGEHTVEFLKNSEAVTKGAFEFLQEMHQLPDDMAEILNQFQFTYFSPDMIEIEVEIMDILLHIQSKDESDETSKQDPLNAKGDAAKNLAKLGQKQDGLLGSSAKQQAKVEKPIVYSSLFSMARSLNQNVHASPKSNPFYKAKENGENKQHSSLNFPSVAREEPRVLENRFERQQDQDREDGQKKDGRHEQGNGQEDENAKKKKQPNLPKDEMKKKVKGVSASRGVSASTAGSARSSGSVGHTPSIDNVYIRFMALMARILGQAEAEAHELYLRIKERTDSIDVLTHLLSKINSEKKDIDWTKNEEMKQLIERARQLGVDIPQGKYKWNEDEKKLLKENIQMRKDSMEKMTQLERTDMQRYLQEASQCHQARSNVLKLLKEVMDTIIANMRP